MGNDGSKGMDGSSHNSSSHGNPNQEYDDDPTTNVAKIRLMDEQIRNRFRRGVQYNLKIIIKGEKKSGKTTLWKRLQGFKFYTQYEETLEIQAATIDWCSKSSDGCAVKVDVWDIVDQGIRNSSSDLCAKEIETNAAKVLLDAVNIDVYRGTHAVIVMVNPFSFESLEYARKEIHQIPSNMAVIFLLNFRDLIEANQYPEYYQSPSKSSNPISSSQIVRICDLYQLVNEFRQKRMEPSIGSEQSSNSQRCTVYATEVSLLNCWGLIELDRFFSIPFLQLKKQSLLEQLNRAESDLLTTCSTLYQDQISWNSEGIPVEVVEKYKTFTHKHSTRIPNTLPLPSPPSPAPQPLPERASSDSSKISPPANSTTSNSQHTNTVGIHNELKQIMTTNIQDSSSLSSSSPSSSPTTSLQLTHAIQSSIPPSATKSPISSKSSESIPNPSFYGEDPIPSSTLVATGEGELEQFIPTNTKNLDIFFGDEDEPQERFSNKGLPSFASSTRSQKEGKGDENHEGEDRTAPSTSSSSSSSPLPSPTPGTTSLVRIKNKKKNQN